MRRVSVLVLALFLMVGCDQTMPKVTEQPTTPTTEPTTDPVTDPTTEPTTEPATQPTTDPVAQPQLSEQTFVFDKSVTWAAYQKDGQWEVLELNKTSDTTLTLAIEQGAVAYVCDQLSDREEVTQNILYFTNAGLRKFLDDYDFTEKTIKCSFAVYPPRSLSVAKIRGAIKGVQTGNNLSISAININQYFYPITISSLENNISYETSTKVETGTYDMVGLRYGENSYAPTHGVVYPGAVTVTDKDETFDIDFADAVKLDSFSFDLLGLGQTTNTWGYVTANGAAMYFGDEFGNDVTSFNYAAFPSNYLVNPQYKLYHSAASNGCYYQVSAAFQTPQNIDVTAPACTEVSFENSHGFQPKLSWNFTETSSYNSFRLSLEQGRIFGDPFDFTAYTANAQFIGNFGKTTSYTFEDFSGLSGWKSEWTLKDRQTVYGLHYGSQSLLPDGRVSTSASSGGTYIPVQ